MLKNPWVLVYLAISFFIGLAHGGTSPSHGHGLVSGIEFMLMGPGAMASVVVDPPGHTNNALVVGVSVVFWLMVKIWSSRRKNTGNVELVRQRSFQIFED